MSSSDADTIAARAPARVFITGANGFIGRALAEWYRRQGAEVRGVDLQGDEAGSVVAGDIAKAGDWQRHAAGCALFLHTAAVVSNTARAEDYRRISVGGTTRALEAAQFGGCRRFVHLSSIAAYGMDFPDGVDECYPVTVLSGLPYCDAKAASEHAVLAAHASGRVDAAIVRPGDVYGPGSRPWVLMPLALMRRRLFVLPMHGKGLFSPVYIDNLVDGISRAAALDAASGGIFNITDGTGLPCHDFFAHHWQWLGRRGCPPYVPWTLALGMAELTRLGARLFGRSTEISPASMRMLARRGTYSIERARRILGYAPAVALAEGMARTREALLRDGLIPGPRGSGASNRHH